MPEPTEYLRLAKLGEKLPKTDGKRTPVRVAVLADHATQRYGSVLKASLFEEGFDPFVYEAPFDSIGIELNDPQSGLFAFNPDFVVFSFSLQRYRERFYMARSEARDLLPGTVSTEIRSMLQLLKDKGISVILNTLPLPIERQFGGFASRTRHSLFGSVLALNQEIIQLAREFQNVHLSDIMYLGNRLGVENFIDEKLWTLSKYPCANHFLPQWVAQVSKPIAATKGKLTKAIVLDLDNTLWGGVIGDDGIGGIQLDSAGPGEGFQRFQHYLRSLRDRGYLLTVCSKNDESAAKLPFKEHSGMILKESDIAVFIANWEPKSANIRTIAQSLNLSLDALVFLDDSPFERDEVRTALPMVTVPELPTDPTEIVPYLESLNLFETTQFSKEDQLRAEQYQVESVRRIEQEKFANIDEYLSSLKMQAECTPFQDALLGRIVQLSQRSNQFNLRTQRLSEQQCRHFLNHRNQYVTLALSLQDRLGEYGLVSLVCAERSGDTLKIIEWVMSCRVLKRGVEEFLLNRLVDEAKHQGASYIEGEYIPTSKNALVKESYPKLGFQNVGDQQFRLSVNAYTPKITFISEGNRGAATHSRGAHPDLSTSL